MLAAGGKTEDLNRLLARQFQPLRIDSMTVWDEWIRETYRKCCEKHPLELPQ